MAAVGSTDIGNPWRALGKRQSGRQTPSSVHSILIVKDDEDGRISRAVSVLACSSLIGQRSATRRTEVRGILYLLFEHVVAVKAFGLL